MFEINPNWHPVFVHFTVALLSLAIVFHIINLFMPDGKSRQDCHRFAQWNLWLGTGFGIVTAIAGWFAYNSVVHDTPSHAAMTEHRNWALVTLGFFILLAGWSIWKERARQSPGAAFVLLLLIGGGLLLSTAWHGGELVYRYGLGVMSLPQEQAENHDHGSHPHSMQSNVDQTQAISSPYPHQEATDRYHESGSEGHEVYQGEVVVPDNKVIDMDSHDHDHHQTHSHSEE